VQTRADGPPTRVLVLVGVLALAVRVVYVFGWKHPVTLMGDAYWYHYGANLLASGHGFIDAYKYKNGIVAQTADHPPLTTFVLALAALCGLRSILSQQLVMCCFGTGTVIIIAVTANRVAGRAGGLVAGLIAAVYPNLWMNDGLMMSETFVQFTTALTILTAYFWWSAPSWRRAMLMGAAAAACALTRAEELLLLPFLVAPLMLLDRRLAPRDRLQHVLMAAVAAVLVLGPWVGYNMTRFDRSVTLTTGLDPALAVANCGPTYSGPFLGWWMQSCILAHPAPDTGDESTQSAYYGKQARSYIESHESRLPVVVAAREGRVWGVFRPFQQITLDRIEAKEYSFSEVGLWMYWGLAIGTVAGIVLLRRLRIPVTPIVGTLATTAVACAVIYGTTRFRASAEVVLVLGAATAVAGLVTHHSSRLPPTTSAEHSPGVVARVP
jgi:4-amino-4-deoxy-L-arabinose transferase-like glycosyltransferase